MNNGEVMKYSVYVIDDEQSIREAVRVAFEDDFRLRTFENAEDGLAAVSEETPDLVLLDIGLPGMNGIQALEKIREISPDVVVIMITAYEDADTVISAMKNGAADYVIKPIDMDRLEVTMNNALESVRLRKEVEQLQEKYLTENIPVFIRESKAIQNVMEFVNKVAKSPDTPVLILGETGTGKELLANAIHFRSPNFKGPFVTVNCAAVPKDLIESELFGYEKGAFTGAHDKGKTGMVEEAAEGTLFLDEVADLSPEAQAKMLRFLETGEFYRVGSTVKRHVTTRIVSATNRNLEDMIEKGAFRKDLFFRLGVIQVSVPSLNERIDEVPVLAEYFLHMFSEKFGKDFDGFSEEALSRLQQHTWSGHVRELKNLVEKAVLVGDGPLVLPEHLGLDTHQPVRVISEPLSKTGPVFPELTDQGVDYEQLQQQFERYYFNTAMKLSGDNMSRAADLLNINYFTFRHRREKLEETADTPDGDEAEALS